MKKADRQRAILKIVASGAIETQEELVERLRAEGISATQATVSRDIRELKLSKSVHAEGHYRYAAPVVDEPPASGKLLKVFSESYVSCVHSGNIVVLKTLVGMANACAVAIDAMKWPDILGSVAGDDTILMVTRAEEDSRRLVARFQSLAEGG